MPDLARRNDPFLLTDMQRAYWVGRRGDLSLGSVSCYLYTEFDTDQVDLARAEAAWNRLVRRHDMLRAVIRADGTQQILAEVPDYRFAVLDLAGTDPAPTLARLRDELPRRIAAPDEWPLFDIRVTRFDGTARLHMGFDLIALDAASIHALRREWGVLYDDLDAPLPPIGVSFRDVRAGPARPRRRPRPGSAAPPTGPTARPPCRPVPTCRCALMPRSAPGRGSAPRRRAAGRHRRGAAAARRRRMG